MSGYQRPWRCLMNTAADKGGSIHDDGTARELGFRAAFVPGNVVAASAVPLIFEHFGPAWMSGGWYSFKFVTPVYGNEPVRAVAEPAGERLVLRVETRDGRLCCVGESGLGEQAPWLAESPEWQDVFPDLTAGFAFPDQDIVLEADAEAATLDAAGDDNAWFRSRSPWGGPVAPPEAILPLALHTMRGTRVPLAGARGPGIWARHHVLLREPLRYHTPYRFSQRVVGKGASARSCFVEYQFQVRAGDRELMVGRHRGKFLKREEHR